MIDYINLATACWQCEEENRLATEQQEKGEFANRT